MGDGELVPGSFIHIEQVGPWAEDIVYPYQNDGSSEVRLGTPTTVETEARVFNTRQT